MQTLQSGKYGTLIKDLQRRGNLSTNLANEMAETLGVISAPMHREADRLTTKALVLRGIFNATKILHPSSPDLPEFLRYQVFAVDRGTFAFGFESEWRALRILRRLLCERPCAAFEVRDEKECVRIVLKEKLRNSA
jgi:hypothetical protein